jgi:uncharacterized repeat protein (TIGR02543 family)
MKHYLKIAAIAWTLSSAAFLSCHKDEDVNTNTNGNMTTYTVTFDADGGAPVPSAQKVEAGKTATAPATHPAKTGYTFLYWCLAGASSAYDFRAPVTTNFTLYAKWETNSLGYVSLNKTKLALHTTDRERLTATGATAVTWATSDRDVVQVSNQGVVTATGAGTAVVTASAGGKPSVCVVSVEPSVITGAGAALWKNGEKIEIKNINAPKDIQSVFVYAGDVYLVGTRTDLISAGNTTTEYSRAVVIRVEFAIGDESNSLVVTDRVLELKGNASYGEDLFISSDGDIHVVGYEIATNEYNTYYRRSVLWKNDKLQAVLSYGTASQNAVARSVFVDGNDVYVAGNYGYWVNDVVWKNGQHELLNEPSGDIDRLKAYSVFVSDGDVYVAGAAYFHDGRYTTPKQVLWKNNVPVILDAGDAYAELYSVFVSGNDVYAAGNQGLWKNGVRVVSDARLKDVCVYGRDVYAAGDEGLWINGVKQSWGAGNSLVVK